MHLRCTSRPNCGLFFFTVGLRRDLGFTPLAHIVPAPAGPWPGGAVGILICVGPLGMHSGPLSVRRDGETPRYRSSRAAPRFTRKLARRGGPARAPAGAPSVPKPPTDRVPLLGLSRPPRASRDLCRCLAWSEKDGCVALGGDKGLLKVLKIESGSGIHLTTNHSLNGHQEPVRVLRWNEKYSKLTSSDDSGMIIVWMHHEGQWYEEMINNRNKSTVKDMRCAPAPAAAPANGPSAPLPAPLLRDQDLSPTVPAGGRQTARRSASRTGTQP